MQAVVFGVAQAGHSCLGATSTARSCTEFTPTASWEADVIVSRRNLSLRGRRVKHAATPVLSQRTVVPSSMAATETGAQTEWQSLIVATFSVAAWKLCRPVQEWEGAVSSAHQVVSGPGTLRMRTCVPVVMVLCRCAWRRSMAWWSCVSCCHMRPACNTCCLWCGATCSPWSWSSHCSEHWQQPSHAYWQRYATWPKPGGFLGTAASNAAVTTAVNVQQHPLPHSTSLLPIFYKLMTQQVS